MSEFDCHVAIRHAKHEVLRGVLASLKPPARERESLEFAWRSDELDMTFEPISPVAAEMNYLGSGSISSTRESAVAYCDELCIRMLDADLVFRGELYNDEFELLFERQHDAFREAAS